jgi:hypothetical protein
MVSADTLFHFTGSIENIKNILINSFSPRYCLERLEFLSNPDFDIAIPMVCFCDIPLSQILEHVNTYGNYAIGLKKDWAINQGISPIIYLHNNSNTNKALNKLFSDTLKFDKILYLLKKDLSLAASRKALELLFYCKVYKGKMWRNNQLKNDIIFYNEREWRFVPKLEELDSINPRYLINKEEYEDNNKRLNLNNLLLKFKIEFTPNDIKYIIVSKENERIKMIQLIEEIKGDDFNPIELKELSSKIISIEQIKVDF